MESIAAILQTILQSARMMALTPEDERIVSYRKIDPLLLALEARARTLESRALAKAIEELKMHLIVLARLDESDGTPDEQHLARVAQLADAIDRGGSGA